MNKTSSTRVTVHENPLTAGVSFRVNKTSYERIVSSISGSWPQWKKELCNNELIISKNSKKLD